VPDYALAELAARPASLRVTGTRRDGARDLVVAEFTPQGASSRSRPRRVDAVRRVSRRGGTVALPPGELGDGETFQ
jgi:hypothetical protein